MIIGEEDDNECLGAQDSLRQEEGLFPPLRHGGMS